MIADAVIVEVGSEHAAVVRPFVRRYFAETDPHELGWRPLAEVADIVVLGCWLGLRLVEGRHVLVGTIAAVLVVGLLAAEAPVRHDDL